MSKEEQIRDVEKVSSYLPKQKYLAFKAMYSVTGAGLSSVLLIILVVLRMETKGTLI